MVINWPNFDIVVFQGIGLPEERERDKERQSVVQSERVHTPSFSDVCFLSWAWLVVTQTITIVTTKITD